MFGSKRKIQQLENQVQNLTEKIKALETKSNLRIYTVEVGKTIRHHLGTNYDTIDKTGAKIMRDGRIVALYPEGVKCLTGEDVI